MAHLLEERSEELAATISAEAGKPLKTARVEAQRAASTYTFAAVEARKLTGETVPMDASPGGRRQARVHAAPPDRDRGRDLPVQLPGQPRRPQDRARTRGRLPGRPEAGVGDSALGSLPREPRSRKPACRRAGSTSSSARPAAIGDELVADERVKLITFTGSGGVGWDLAERAHTKRVKLELGNATPAIVCADAPDDAAGKLAANAFSFAGQSCISVQRIYVLAERWDSFVADFVPRVEALKVGDPATTTRTSGP